jgi:hypothetical protein
MIRYLVLGSIAAFIATSPAIAQNSIPNPLRPAPAERRATEPAAPTAQTNRQDDATAPAKPRRERSAKQRQNDDDMRACGASWRADKASHTAKGLTWRSYLKDCRAAKKAGREKV